MLGPSATHTWISSGGSYGSGEMIPNRQWPSSSAGAMKRSLGIRPEVIAHDLHADYASTRYALARPKPLKVAVQHNHAHVASAMGEHGLEGPVRGLAWTARAKGRTGRLGRRAAARPRQRLRAAGDAASAPPGRQRPFAVKRGRGPHRNRFPGGRRRRPSSGSTSSRRRGQRCDAGRWNHAARGIAPARYNRLMSRPAWPPCRRLSEVQPCQS